MLHTYRYWLVSLIGLLAVVLSACSGGGSAAPTATATLVAAAPTRTPRPTLPPEPTATPRPSPSPVPTTALTSGQLAPVEIGPLETYRHPSGIFSLDVPNNWTLQDGSSPDELLIIWTDPTGNGAILVNIFEDNRSLTDSQLVDLLNTFLEDRFRDEPDFIYEKPRPQSDGSQLVVWSYSAPADNNVRVTLLGNSFVEQRGNKVSILTTLVPDDQFENLRSKTDTIINTYRINADVSLDGGTTGSGTIGSGTIGSSTTGGGTTGGGTTGGILAPVEIGQLRTFTHPSGVFSLDLPVNWTLTDSSRTGELILVWTDPLNNAAIIVDIFEDNTKYSDSQLAEILVKFLKNTFGNQPDFATEDPRPQSDGSILIIWGYTSTADNNMQVSMLGNSFIEQRGNKVSVLTTLVPQEQFDTLVSKTNEIINSYRIDPNTRVP